VGEPGLHFTSIFKLLVVCRRAFTFALRGTLVLHGNRMEFKVTEYFEGNMCSQREREVTGVRHRLYAK
jgi:hypothetical protein